MATSASILLPEDDENDILLLKLALNKAGISDPLTCGPRRPRGHRIPEAGHGPGWEGARDSPGPILDGSQSAQDEWFRCGGLVETASRVRCVAGCRVEFL